MEDALESLDSMINKIMLEIATQKKKKGRVSPELAIELEELEVLNNLSELFDISSPLYIRHQAEVLNERLTKRIKELSPLSKKDLMDLVANLELDLEVSEYVSGISRKITKALFELMQSSHEQRLKVSKKRAGGRAKLYIQNKSALEAVFLTYSQKVKRPLSLVDYPGFEELVIKTHPSPPYIPAPRISKKELLTSKQLEGEIEDLKRDGWAKSTIYEFFKQQIEKI